MPSSVIRRFDYDDDTSTLDILFTTGRRYRYFAVPPETVEGLRAASSRGRYFNLRIRDFYDFLESA